MSIKVNLTSESIAILERVMAAGEFESIDDALNQAVHNLELAPFEDDLEERLQPALAQLERGEGIPYTPELVKRAFDRARADFVWMRSEKMGA